MKEIIFVLAYIGIFVLPSAIALDYELWQAIVVFIAEIIAIMQMDKWNTPNMYVILCIATWGMFVLVKTRVLGKFF